MQTRETYQCKCGGTLTFNYDAKPSSAWQCDRCDFETSHVRVDKDGDIHPNTFLHEYGARKRLALTMRNFDIYKGMTGRDFIFRGCDQFKGAMFEHTCGWTVRVGPEAAVSFIADMIRRHDCKKDKK